MLWRFYLRHRFRSLQKQSTAPKVGFALSRTTTKGVSMIENQETLSSSLDAYFLASLTPSNRDEMRCIFCDHLPTTTEFSIQIYCNVMSRLCFKAAGASRRIVQHFLILNMSSSTRWGVTPTPPLIITWKSEIMKMTFKEG